MGRSWYILGRSPRGLPDAGRHAKAKPLRGRLRRALSRRPTPGKAGARPTEEIPGPKPSNERGLDDAQLTKLIEQSPKWDIDLSANYLKQLSANPYGANTDEDLFVLYSTGDNANVRKLNAQYGSDYSQRGGDIKARMQDWDTISSRITVADEWSALSTQQQSSGVRQLASDNPYWLANGNGSLNFPYPAPPGVITNLQGAGANSGDSPVPDPQVGAGG